MTLKKTAVALFILTGFAFTCCNVFKEANPGATNIRGKIEFPPSGKIIFYSYADSVDLYLERKTAIDSSAIDKDGNYSITPHCKGGCSFDLKCGDKFIVTNLFLLPGDKIKIDFYGKENKPEIFPTNEAEKLNNFLVKFGDEFYRNPETKYVYYISTNYMDGPTFTEYNIKRKQKQIDFFTNTFKNDSLKKESRDYVTNTINYGIAVDRLMYLWKKRMKSEHITVDSSYLAFETPDFIENKDALNCPSYTRFLYLYIKDTYERMVERGDLPADKSQKLIPQVEKYKLATKLLGKPYNDIVLYTVILGDMTQKENEVYSARMPLDSLKKIFRNKYSL